MGAAPVVAFLNRGEQVSNLTGEKLSEHQVVTAVNGALARLELPVTSYVVAPTWNQPLAPVGPTKVV